MSVYVRRGVALRLNCMARVLSHEFARIMFGACGVPRALDLCVSASYHELPSTLRSLAPFHSR